MVLRVTVVPATVQTAVVRELKVTVKPESALALRAGGVSSRRRPVSAPKVMVWAVLAGVSALPATHSGGESVGLAVPLEFPTTELATAVPEHSLRPKRPIRPEALVSSWVIVAWMSACERATLQIRDSSRKPAKEPSRPPVEFIAVARPACWMLSERGATGAPRSSVVSRVPSR